MGGGSSFRQDFPSMRALGIAAIVAAIGAYLGIFIF